MRFEVIVDLSWHDGIDEDFSFCEFALDRLNLLNRLSGTFMSDSRNSDPRAISCTPLRGYKSFDLKTNSDVFKIKMTYARAFWICSRYGSYQDLLIELEGVAMVAFRNLLLKTRLSLVSYKNRFRHNERPTTLIELCRWGKKHISILIKLKFLTLIYSLCLENGATMTPKRRLLLTLIFACLCFLKK